LNNSKFTIEKNRKLFSTYSKINEFHKNSIENKESFWKEESKQIDWQTPFDSVLEYDNPPFRKWFVNGKTNLCHNALDRHLKERGDQNALIYISPETNVETSFTYKQLYKKVNTFAKTLQKMGISKGDVVLIYMPMIPEAIVAMLATVRLGAVHSVVFAGFAPTSLAARIDDAKPKVIITATNSSRGGNKLKLLPLLKEAVNIATHKTNNVIVVPRPNIDDKPFRADENENWLDYSELEQENENEIVECEWVESNHPSYILYTSGTTGKPKGIVRDTGGYAVTLMSSMKYIFETKPGQVHFNTSDIGWVVGHSYIAYAPLLNGSVSILFEGIPIKPNASIWWQIVEKYKVSSMFSSPTAIRVLKQHSNEFVKQCDTSSLKTLFLAGEPVDAPSTQWIDEALEKKTKIIDNYWQTETGAPILSAMFGVEKTKLKPGSPSFPVYGYDIVLIDEQTGKEIENPNERGILCAKPPLPPGACTTIHNNDKRFVETYFKSIQNNLIYSTFDVATKDEEGYYYIQGRSDDIINVAAHRFGSREIEECLQKSGLIIDCAVIGKKDELKGETICAFVIVGEEKPNIKELLQNFVIKSIGKVAKPEIYVVDKLPKTRSGKLLRRAMKAICDNEPVGDTSTLEDSTALESIRNVLKQ